MTAFSRQVREWANRLKQQVIVRSRLRGLLRRWVVTPLQLLQLRRLRRLLPPAGDGSDQRPRVVVLALRHWAVSRAWESVFTRILNHQGCAVTWVYDDRVMLRCDSMPSQQRDLTLCRHCVRFNRRAASAIGTTAVPLGDFLPPDHAEVGVKEVRGDDFARRYDEVRASFQRLLASRPTSLQDPPAEERKILDELLISAERVHRCTENLFTTLRPDTVLALNGKFFAESILLENAQRRGIPVWTYERGNRRNTVVLAPGKTAVPFDTTAILAQLNRPLDASERDAADRYLERRMELGNGQIRLLDSTSRPLELTQGREQLLALFTNLIWDSAVVGEDTVFDDMFDWLITTVRAVESQPTTHLVIRVHPAEVKVFWHPTRERVADVLAAAFPSGLPTNVTLVDAAEPVDSYDLALRADQVLVYTSTIGLEAAALQRKVVVAAHSNYSAAPFVVRPESREEYLDEILRGGDEPPPEADALARRFLYRLYFEEMLEVPAVREDPTGFHVTRPAGEGANLKHRLRQLSADAKAHAATAYEAQR